MGSCQARSAEFITQHAKLNSLLSGYNKLQLCHHALDEKYPDTISYFSTKTYVVVTC